jgi:hypothetical protein
MMHQASSEMYWIYVRCLSRDRGNLTVDNCVCNQRTTMCSFIFIFMVLLDIKFISHHMLCCNLTFSLLLSTFFILFVCSFYVDWPAPGSGSVENFQGLSPWNINPGRF